MSRFLRKEKRKQERGITLIALITTIIVLLILAGITIGAITGSNGIIGQAQSAKEETEISQEKEIIDISTVEAMGKNNRGNLEEEEFQNVIDKHTNEKADVTDIGEEFEVLFEESNRYYIVDKDGNILSYDNVVIDNSPGDMTKDETGKNLAGTTDEPYEIWCIEDLVEWSQNYLKYKNSSIKLCRTLNFNSNMSYVDGKILNCSSIDELKDLLTNNFKNGFTPIANFSGNFYGQGFEIQNLYEKVTGDAGLFATITNANISNIGISGSITSLENSAGGIVGSVSSGTIKQCTNSAEVVSMLKSAGGIVGCGGTIEECYNYGDIYSYGSERANYDYVSSSAGGIVGSFSQNIQNCGNSGNVTSNLSAGGIIGYKYYSFNIINCYNTGEIIGTKYSGGIIGETLAGTCTIYNCYNTGKVRSENIAGGIVANIYYTTKLSLCNDCNIGEISGNNGTGGIAGKSEAGSTSYESYMPTFKNVYSCPSGVKAVSNMTVDTIILFDDNLSNIVNKLNLYIDSETETDTSNWKKWKYDNDNSIMFE